MIDRKQPFAYAGRKSGWKSGRFEQNRGEMNPVMFVTLAWLFNDSGLLDIDGGSSKSTATGWKMIPAALRGQQEDQSNFSEGNLSATAPALHTGLYFVPRLKGKL